MKLPRFIPILTSFTARVAGRDVTQLLQSPTDLARALADTQIVVGHDGVLCLYDPLPLEAACIGRTEGKPPGIPGSNDLTSPEEVKHTEPINTLLEAIQPLHHQLQDRALIFATFAGPGLLFSQLQSAFKASGLNDEPDPNYIISVLRNVVRAALDLKADGIALIEQLKPGIPSKLLRTHKAVRKLADFYDAGFLVFLLSESEQQDSAIPAHCVFDLAPTNSEFGPVIGRADPSTAPDFELITTVGDVAVNTPVDELKSLMRTGGSGQDEN